MTVQSAKGSLGQIADTIHTFEGTIVAVWRSSAAKNLWECATCRDQHKSSHYQWCAPNNASPSRQICSCGVQCQASAYHTESNFAEKRQVLVEDLCDKQQVI